MNNKMRIFHRYLGFFLSGIMAVYAISGIVMIFRETEFLKSEREIEKQLAVDLPDAEVGSTLRIKEFKVERSEGSLIYFREGTYDKKTGLAKFKAKQLPYVLDKMTKLHKATTKPAALFPEYFLWCGTAVFRVVRFLDVYAQDRG